MSTTSTAQLLPEVDLLDLLADLDLIRCTCGCDAVFDLAAYEKRANVTGIRFSSVGEVAA
jgi:hypothetical protein